MLSQPKTGSPVKFNWCCGRKGIRCKILLQYSHSCEGTRPTSVQRPYGSCGCVVTDVKPFDDDDDVFSPKIPSEWMHAFWTNLSALVHSILSSYYKTCYGRHLPSCRFHCTTLLRDLWQWAVTDIGTTGRVLVMAGRGVSGYPLVYSSGGGTNWKGLFRRNRPTRASMEKRILSRW